MSSLAGLLLVAYVVCCVSGPVSCSDDDQVWRDYKHQHGKSYNSGRTEARRRGHFELNRARVESHNAEAENGTHSYNLTLNHLADRPPRRLLHRRLTGLLKSGLGKSELQKVLASSDAPVPDELDWREEGFRTRTWNQGDCGSCYAFTMASVVEGQVFKDNGSLVELSRQQLVDCSVLNGNLGCDGGSFSNTARYLQRNGLLPTDQYPTPYKGKQSLCRALGRRTKGGLRASSWGVVPTGDEAALAAVVARVGPVAVSVNAAPYSFQLYHSGVYDDPACTGDSLNHAMLLLGYTQDSWLVKNWWGGKWGQGGYMRIRRGVNRCGIADFALYLKLQEDP